MNAMTSERLEMRWLAVTDGAGRTRMEASWVQAPVGLTPAQPTSGHAA